MATVPRVPAGSLGPLSSRVIRSTQQQFHPLDVCVCAIPCESVPSCSGLQIRELYGWASKVCKYALAPETDGHEGQAAAASEDVQTEAGLVPSAAGKEDLDAQIARHSHAHSGASAAPADAAAARKPSALRFGAPLAAAAFVRLCAAGGCTIPWGECAYLLAACRDTCGMV